MCKQEQADGRRVLLLCQQTDTLDIQPEWQRMLEEAGLKTAILRAAPNKREQWVEKQVRAGVDVIISHPRKVETGIDLLDFPTIVWMAIDYSVYTVLQASRRSWRIGQTRPVKVYYFAYADTIQEDALHLVAAKVAATLRVNGDTVGDDSLAELDNITAGDLVATLAKIVTGETTLNAPNLQQAFAEANAGLRQANTIIGDYRMVDAEDADIGMETAVNGNGQQPRRPRLPVNGAGRNGRASLQPELSSNGNGKMNGNGHGHVSRQNGTSDEKSAQKKEPAEKSAIPPVPRPRLFGIRNV